MKKVILGVIGILALSLLLSGCMSEEESMEQLGEMDDAGLEAVAKDDSTAVAGQAYANMVPQLNKWASKFTCTDSDGGTNFEVAGTVTLTGKTFSKSYDDKCAGDSVIELWCDDNYMRRLLEPCNSGCNGGKCNLCGDGELLVDFEQCDDGNADDDDGCTAECKLEEGFDCFVDMVPTVCEPTCRDGMLVNGEKCDGTNFATSCEDEGFSGGEISCNDDCTVDTSGCAYCGDGIIDSEENCDDGDAESGDGCDQWCTAEPGYNCIGEPSVCQLMYAECGNGAIEGNEMCDDGNQMSGDGCSNICTVEMGYVCGGEPSTCMPLSTGCTSDTECEAGKVCSIEGFCVDCDYDNDGYGGTMKNCPLTGNDCDDYNAAIYPGATEVCDNVDNDCDGQVDEGC